MLIIHSMFDEESFINEFGDSSLALSNMNTKIIGSFSVEILEKLMLQIDKFPEEYQYYFVDVLGIKRNLSFYRFRE